MAYIDVFNGDADGICALIQLRLAHPQQSTLVTGVKRDINLLAQVQAQPNDVVTVLDISLDKNRVALQNTLANGALVQYFDHHFAGEIPEHPCLQAHINEAADVCTSLLVNGNLKGKYLAWAIVGAYGDNLNKSAERLQQPLSLTPSESVLLANLGNYLNYNGYGESMADLHFTPADLFKRASHFLHPLEFIAADPATYSALEEGYKTDMASAANTVAEWQSKDYAVFILPNTAWARRVSGVYSNDLTNQFPDRAHAVLTAKPCGGYLVSVRAPLTRKSGAETLCRQFASGGGRSAAAGIDHLPAAELSRFIDLLSSQYTL